MEEEDHGDEVNPYAPPTSPVHAEGSRRGAASDRLAGRGARLVAAMIDGTIKMLILVLFLWLSGMLDSMLETATESMQETIVLTIAGVVAYGLVNGYLLANRGQTVGKVAMSIRIVRVDGAMASFGQVFGMRYALLQLIYMFPIVWTFSLLDALFIFGSHRRCLHDMIAGTKVVETR